MVTHCLPENEDIPRTLSEFPRSARGGDVIALGLLFTPGARCSQLILRRYQPSFAPIFSCQPFRESKLTKPHQGFILIILSNLALALVQSLAICTIKQLTSSADTAPPLLVEHSEADICLNTGREGLLGSPPNSPERLRVARRVKEKVLDMSPSLPSEPYVQLSLYTAQATS